MPDSVKPAGNRCTRTIRHAGHRNVRISDVDSLRTGLGNRFAGVYSPAASFENIARVAEDLRDPLLELCRSAARDADVLILAGAPIAGLASEIREKCRHSC